LKSYIFIYCTCRVMWCSWHYVLGRCLLP